MKRTYEKSQRKDHPFWNDFFLFKLATKIDVFASPGAADILATTKYVYIKSITVYVPSSELVLSQPLSRQRVFPSPQKWVGEGAHSPAGEGLG